MSAFILSVIAILHLALVVVVWRANPKRPAHRFYAFHALMFMGWTSGIAWIQSGVGIEGGAKLTFASASLVPAALLLFTIHYPDAEKSSWRAPQLLVLAVGAFFAIASVMTDSIVYDTRWTAGVLSRRPGPLYPWFTVYVALALPAAVGVFVRKWWSAKGWRRIQLGYYGVGLLFALVGAVTANLIIPAVTGRSDVSHLGPYFGSVLIALTAHATLRDRLMDLRLVVHRCLTIGIAVTISLLPILILATLVRGSMLIDVTVVEALLIGGAFLAVALLIPVTADVAERFIDRYVYRGRESPQRLLRRASNELAQTLDLERVLAIIAETIRVAAPPHGVAVYLEHSGALRLSTSNEAARDTGFSAPAEPARPVIDAVIVQAAPVLRDELTMPGDAALHEALTGAGWALILPLFADQRLVGIIAVGSKRSGDPFFSEDVDALATLVNHAGTVVRNAQLHAQVVLANEHVHRIVTAMQNGVVVLDASGTVTLINPAARDALRLPEDVLLNIDDLPAPLRDSLAEVLTEHREGVTREVTWSHDDVTPRALLCTASILPAHESERPGAVIVFSDVTPLKELAKQRTRAEHLSGLQRLTQALAHEIGNPLVPIKTLTKLLPERVGNPAFAERVSRIVSHEIERIERLVERLRRVAPSSGVNYSVVDLRVPLRHALELIEATAAEQETHLEIDLPSDEVLVLGDSTEIEELFLNLLTNALEAVVEMPRDSRRVRSSLHVGTDHVVAQVSDSGPGISAEVMDRMFDPFVSTKSRGSGLGLAICHAIVERHRGRLTAANAHPCGAVFTVTLHAVETITAGN